MQGLIDLARARILSDLTYHYLEELARKVTETALVRAPSMTTGQLRAHLQRLIITVDPAAARERYEQKLEERRVFSEQAEDGTANLLGSQPASGRDESGDAADQPVGPCSQSER